MASVEIESYEPPSQANLARNVARILLRAIGLVMTIALAVVVGIWSSQFLVSRGSPLSTDTYGPWQHWRNLGRDFADPYTKAHIANTGTLRIASNSAGIFEARTDDLGARLHSSCNYVIEGTNMSGMWWSLAVFDSRGRLIANDFESLHFHGRHRRAKPKRVVYRHARPRRAARQLAADKWRRPPGPCPYHPRSIDGPFGRSARRTQQGAPYHTPRGLLMNLKSLVERVDWRLLLIFILVAAIVHVLETFLAVNDQRNAAYARLARELPHNTMTIADPVTPEHQALPFLAPDAHYAFCPFETNNSPMHVNALLPDLGWTIGIYAPDGSGIYFAAASADRETIIDLSIIPSDDRFLGLPAETPGRPGIDNQQTIAAPKGLIVVRAPDKGAPYRAEEDAILAKATCVSGRA